MESICATQHRYLVFLLLSTRKTYSKSYIHDIKANFCTMSLTFKCDITGNKNKEFIFLRTIYLYEIDLQDSVNLY